MIPKIDQDIESTRHQRNMTKTQKRNDSNIKEGVIVNSFVKDPLLSLDETCDTLIISNTNIDLPQKVYEKETKQRDPLIPLCIATVGVMALLGGFTAMMKKFSKGKLESTKEYLLPGMTRNHCINDEIHQSIFSMIQSPSRKTILASFGVITLGSMAFMGKIFIDGFKDVWIKKQEADIQKNLQENLIEVETQSFSGKIQIIRSMLSSKAKIFSQELTFKANNDKASSNTITKNNSDEISSSRNKDKKMWLIGGATLLSILGLGYFATRNIRKSDEFIRKGIKNTKTGIDNLIDDFNSGKPLDNIQAHNGMVLSGKDAYKALIENMLETIYAKPEEIERVVNKLNLPQSEKEEFIRQLKDDMNQATEQVNPMMGGSGRNKITYFSHVNDYLSFFYDWLMNPKNPQFKNLFFGIAGVSALAYGGKTAAEAVKDVQVKKYNAETELELQKRLVSTELRNFKAKKESAIEPLCDEFYLQKDAGKSKEELKIIADNILFEIKNGPPFVYS
ncbi:hypothetical protein EGQ24_02380 [bacterium]|nr:hypothetical protein [bacterium]